MLKKLMSLSLAVFFAGSIILQNARAEEGFTAEKFPYKEMQIQVMPEFDYPEKWPEGEPSLLVGYYGTVVNKTGKDFTGTVELPLPANGKNFSVYLVAEFPEDNKPEVQRPFKIDEEKGVVSWEPGKAIKKDGTYRFVIEYYANPFKVSGADKQFNFEHTPQADIEKLDVIVYTPLKAEGFTIDPKAENISKSDYGEELQHYQYANVKKGEGVKYSAYYKKQGNESTLSLISKMNPPKDENHSGATATEQVTKNTSAAQSTSSDVGRPLIDAAAGSIIGISIIIAGVFVYFGLRGNRIESKSNTAARKNGNKPSKGSTSRAGDTGDEKKKLRKMLMNGKIDQQTYEEKMKKLI
ncbi:hypothetical protein [Bacillus sp. T33-2]|uniref:hypothetical protein n=1 Tax=Bacillus sp. T33-2 TaxID=2054168 RepID=UPI000C765622|nr:hypothetical protein [Bacillus sp. T33-2]PLR99900.1 hypothetical protein CVD19_02275 [Bacillus sp. T33-2]